MDIKRLIRIVTLYFLPVILTHMIFAILDQNLQNQLWDIEVIFEERRNLINIAVYFYFLAIPLYLALSNVIFHMNKEHYLYIEEIKFTYLSIFIGNLIVYIYNMVNLYKFGSLDLNPFLELICVLIPQGIVLGMLLFLGFLLVKKRNIESISEKDIEEDDKLRKNTFDTNIDTDDVFKRNEYENNVEKDSK